MIEGEVGILDGIGPPHDLSARGKLFKCAVDVRLSDFRRPDAHYNLAQQKRLLIAISKKLSNRLDVCQRTYFLTFDSSSAGTSAGSKRIDDASLKVANRLALKSVA